MRCRPICNTSMTLQSTPAKWWKDTCEWEQRHVVYVYDHLKLYECKKLEKCLFSGQETVPPKQRRSGHGCNASGSESLASRVNRGWTRDGVQGLRHSSGYPRTNTSHHQRPGGKRSTISTSEACTAQTVGVAAIWCKTCDHLTSAWN